MSRASDPAAEPRPDEGGRGVMEYDHGLESSWDGGEDDVPMNDARDELEAMGRVAGGVAQAINTPTQYVMSNLVYLRRALERVTPILRHVQAQVERGEADDTLVALAARAHLDRVTEEAPGAAEDALQGLEGISRVVSAMTDLSLPRVGEFTIEDPMALLETAAIMSAHTWREHARLEVERLDRPAVVPVMREELTRAIIAMLHHAAHSVALENGRSGRRHGRILLTPRVAGDWFELDLSDDGAPMDPESRANAFDVFAGAGRGAETPSLAGARAVICLRHAGELKLMPPVLSGATFRVRLPLEQEDHLRGAWAP